MRVQFIVSVSGLIMGVHFSQKKLFVKSWVLSGWREWQALKIWHLYGTGP